MQPLGEEMERVARVSSIGLGKPDEAVDEDPSRANLRGLLEERAVGSLHLLLEQLPRGEDQLQSPVPLEPAQVPPEERRVANELVRGDLEQHDHPRLVELAGAAIHELDAEGRLPRSRRSRDQDDVPPRNTAKENSVEPFDSCLDQIGFRHEVPLASGDRSSVRDGFGLATTRARRRLSLFENIEDGQPAVSGCGDSQERREPAAERAVAPRENVEPRRAGRVRGLSQKPGGHQGLERLLDL